MAGKSLSQDGTIPSFQEAMLPLLRVVSDGKDHRFRDVVESLANHFALGDKERLEMLPSGRQPKFVNRVGWATTHLFKAALIERPRHGYLRITKRGLSLLEENPGRIDLKLLDRYPEHAAFRNKGGKALQESVEEGTETPEERTPSETIEAAYRVVRDSLAADLLLQIKACTPEFFERLVVDVLVGMGYGGTREDAGRAIGKSGDEGVDGIINEDRLGLDVIYVQAKRWEGTVGRPEIQRFVGALQGQKARKGVFITTSDFSRQAREYASNIETNVVLIDGESLSNLMIDHNVGTTVVSSYEIKRIDSDYFEEA
jgi:restriction system protein